MDYATVKVPRRLVAKVQPLMEPNGYRSFSEFVMEAIRERAWHLYLESRVDAGDLLDASVDAKHEWLRE